MMLKSTTQQKKQSRQLKEDWKPHNYQKKAVREVLQNASKALFMDPGLGKTSVILAALKILKKEKVAVKTLIIAPLRVCYLVWPKELEHWNDFSSLTYQILHGKDKEKNLQKDADIYIINPEGLSWLFKQPFKKYNFDTLVIDESSKFKASNTQRFKLLKNHLPSFRRRYILTGSPTPNTMMDLFSQIFILDLGASLGKYITHFRNNYFYPTGFGGYEWKLKETGEKEIQAKIKPLVLRLEADD